MCIFLEQRTKVKKTLPTQRFLLHLWQFSITQDSSEGTVFFYCIRHFRDYPLLDKHKTSSFMNTGFFKKTTIEQKLKLPYKGVMISSEQRQVSH